jgi:hypothetical protein
MLYVARKLEKVQRTIDEDVPQLKIAIFGPPDQGGRPKHEEGIEDRLKVETTRGKKNQIRSTRNERKIKKCLQLIEDTVAIASGSSVGNTGKYQTITNKIRIIRESDSEPVSDPDEDGMSEDDLESSEEE